MATEVLNNPLELHISDRLAKNFRRNLRERIIEFILMLAALSAVATTVSIVAILLYESFSFFKHVSIVDFLTDTQWTPLFEDAHYGILPLVSGTLTTSGIAHGSHPRRHHRRNLPV
jgi:phosphate transport system permease protein